MSASQLGEMERVDKVAGFCVPLPNPSLCPGLGVLGFWALSWATVFLGPLLSSLYSIVIIAFMCNLLPYPLLGAIG